MYSIGQKEVLDLLFRDVWILIEGKEQLSDPEYLELVNKYHVEV